MPDEYVIDREKWGAALTEERAVRWVWDSRARDEHDDRDLADVPDSELAERSGLAPEVVQRARQRVDKWYAP